MTDRHRPPQAVLTSGGARPAAQVVEFLDVPVAAYAALQEWNDAVFRECELIAALGPGRSDLPPRLVDLAALLSGHYAPEMDGLRDTVDQARGRGDIVVDLQGTWPTPAAQAVASAEAFLAMMEELDEFCGSDVLLTAPPEPEVVRLRRWFVTEVRAQLVDAADPLPFSGAP